MNATYENDITDNLKNDRNLILLGVRADADIQHLKQKIKHIDDAAKMAAKVMTGKDWHTLSMREHDLVKYLFRAGLIEKENSNGFVGRAI